MSSAAATQSRRSRLTEPPRLIPVSPDWSDCTPRFLETETPARDPVLTTNTSGEGLANLSEHGWRTITPPPARPLSLGSYVTPALVLDYHSHCSHPLIFYKYLHTPKCIISAICSCVRASQSMWSWPVSARGRRAVETRKAGHLVSVPQCSWAALRRAAFCWNSRLSSVCPEPSPHRSLRASELLAGIFADL